MNLITIKEGLRMWKRSRRVNKEGFKIYKGDSKKICRQIIDECYDRRKKYFRVSSGHFCVFYSRDFGWCCESLLKLGYRNKVIDTLDYALGVFKREGRVFTSINPEGTAFDFPREAVDSLPYLVRSLRLAKNKKLIEKYKCFVEAEVQRYYQKIIDSEGLVRKDRYFSSIKDHAKRKSSCYDNSMIGMMSEDLDKLGFFNPLNKFDYPNLIVEHFWTGRYFRDDLESLRFSSDSNLFPFWTGIVKDKKKFKSVCGVIERRKVDRPFPLKYDIDGSNDHDFFFYDWLAPGYERDAIWQHIGMIYLELLKRYDKKRFGKIIDKYEKLFKKYSNFLEVYAPDGKPFKSWLYSTDESMLWCSIFLRLKR